MIELDKIHCMDCIEGMKLIDDNTIDACVTDPPYGLEFMGKDWDKFKNGKNIGGGTANKSTPFSRAEKGKVSPSFYQLTPDCMKNFQDFTLQWATEVYRILKPGAHLLSFGGSRTYHRMACAIEDAGFEIRDMINWVYGSGFPKSLNVGKAIDKLQGNEREIIGKKSTGSKFGISGNGYSQPKWLDVTEVNITSPTSDEAKQWNGWGTALKPAHEPIVLARKPLSEPTVAKNVLKWGTGGLNIDGCRISHNEPIKTTNRKQMSAGWNPDNCGFDSTKNTQASASPLGRFPANFIHDGSIEVETIFSKAGVSKSSGGKSGHTGAYSGGYKEEYYGDMKPGFGDTGTPSRFFYCAKASKEERNIGVKHIEKTVGHNRFDKCAVCGGYMLQNPDRPSACKCEHPVRQDNIIKGNHHPTVKPIALMEYLVKLVTRDGQLVLDPFIGSGTTALACRRINRHFIGFEINQEYIEIANNRLANIPKRIETYGND